VPFILLFEFDFEFDFEFNEYKQYTRKTYESIIARYNIIGSRGGSLDRLREKGRKRYGVPDNIGIYR
jgi:hypothetical protein